MNKLKLNQLEMLVAVADAGSFSKAAAQLDCTQSRISHAVAELEQELGARLLTRAHAGSVPTPEGQRVLFKARQILTLANELLEPAHAAQALTGRVTLACFRSIGTHILPHALALLAARHPGIQIAIEDDCLNADDVHASVLAGRADIGFGCAPYEEDFIVRPLLQDDYVLVVPSSLGLNVLTDWSQLDSLPLIEAMTRRTAIVLQELRAQGFTARTSQRLASDTMILAMVALGQGFSIFQRLAAHPLPPGVAVLPLPQGAYRREFGLIALPATARRPEVQAVLRTLRDKAMLQHTPVARAGLIHLD